MGINNFFPVPIATGPSVGTLLPRENDTSAKHTGPNELAKMRLLLNLYKPFLSFVDFKGISLLPLVQLEEPLQQMRVGSGDLSFRAGEVMNVLKQDGEWWEAEKNGARGLIPGNYVSVL